MYLYVVVFYKPKPSQERFPNVRRSLCAMIRMQMMLFSVAAAHGPKCIDVANVHAPMCIVYYTCCCCWTNITTERFFVEDDDDGKTSGVVVELVRSSRGATGRNKSSSYAEPLELFQPSVVEEMM